MGKTYVIGDIHGAYRALRQCLDIVPLLFVHAGIDPHLPLAQQGLDTFLWDRNLAIQALDCYRSKMNEKLTGYEEIYIGHTPTTFMKPVRGGDVWLMDTGAGWTGVLSMMDVDTKEIFTSDPVPELYPGETGRGSR